ncbi:hypothetical protein TNCV_4313821 [Trichonephila clavipes]|nr:hypothetical protein TNCV_4313821 [Trichonephila clavipes]
MLDQTYNTNDDPSIEQKGCATFHSRRESISGESTTYFPEDISMPYLDPSPPGPAPEVLTPRRKKENAAPLSKARNYN